MGTAARNGGFVGEQRIYASHHSIMFSRKSCYFFVRPKQMYLELCVFLGRRLEAPQVRRVDQASKSKLYHLIRITHRDEVEPPITDWLQEAYMLSNELSKPGAAKSTPPGKQQRHGNPRALSSQKRFSENQDRLQNAVCKSNLPALAWCPRGFGHDSEEWPMEGWPVTPTEGVRRSQS